MNAAQRPATSTSPIDIPMDAPPSLLDLMSDGFYMLLLIKRGQAPQDEQAFAAEVRQFLGAVERNASRHDIAGEDVHAAKYAYCAAIDEAILTSSECTFRESWAREPLQLTLFGDHLAGENFFDRLEQLRAQGAPRLAALEVFYFCLLLGFEGKYLLEGPEKLGYLSARVGDEILYLKGKRTGFSPHWAPPDRITHALRRTAPVWIAAAAMAAIGIISYATLRISLQRNTTQGLSAYSNLVQLPERTANLTITLP